MREQMQDNLKSISTKLSLLFLSHGHYFLCPLQNAINAQWEKAKKKGKRKKHIVGGGKEKVAGEGQQVLDLDTAKAREEETGGKPQEDKYAIVWLVPM